MTTAQPKLSPVIAETLERKENAQGWEAIFESLGERLNPILVKEARQALKSKQFVITFMLLLTCGWCWTVLGVALQAGSIYYAESGQFMLGGYFVVLCVPLMIIVPFASFRSIAAEKDYGTFELLSITALNSRQIVTGKLAVSVLQMIVYMSTLAPFIAFTYMLRGVDLLAIFWLLGMTLLFSLLFSSVSILIGTVTRSSHWQVVLSVLLLGAVGFATIMWIALVLDEVLDSSAPFLDPEFWIINTVCTIMTLTYVVLSVVAASSMVSFASDNRSTPIRVALLAQQAIFAACMLYTWMFFEDNDFFVPFVMLAAISWAFCGALMTSEMGELSARVKRTLPRSALGRLMLTWFFPGSGSGYVFAVCSFAALATTACGVGIVADWLDLPGAPNGSDDLYSLAIVHTCYIAGYLGLGRLIILLIRRRYNLPLFGGVLVHVILIALGGIAPTVFQLMLHKIFGSDYSLIQAPNWAWTTVAILDRDFWGSRYTWGWPLPPTLILAPIAASLIFVVNLIFAVREIEQVRLAVPQRVREDLSTGRDGKPRGPWDDDEASSESAQPAPLSADEAGAKGDDSPPISEHPLD